MREYPVNPNVYSGGAVVFNSAPFANFFLQQQAKRQQKEQALDSYYNDQAKALTPTGMRAKDIENGWSQKFNSWQKLGIENRKALLNPSSDGYKTLNEFNRLKNELLSDTERSKAAAKNEDFLRQLKTSGKWNPTDDDFDIATDNSLSIYDPNRRNRSLDELSVNYAPFDATKYLTAVQGGMKRGKVELNRTLDPKQGLQTITEVEQYTPTEIKAMAEKAPLFLQTDRSSKIEFERMLNNPQQHVALQEAYEKLYPGDVVDSPEKAAKAFTIMNVAQPTAQGVRTEKYEDPERSLNNAMKLAAYNSGLRKSEERLKARLNGEGNPTSAISAHIDNIVQEAKAKPQLEVTINGNKKNLYQIPVTPSLGKSLEKVDAMGEKRTPNIIGVDDDGSFFGIFYKPEVKNDKYTGGFEKTKSGNPVIDGGLTNSINRSIFQSEYANQLLTPKSVEGALSKGGETIVAEAEIANSAPSDWKQEGNNYRYKDGRLFDASGKVIGRSKAK